MALLLSAPHDLALDDGPGREQSLTARARAFVVIEELERAFPQLHDRHVGRRAHVERAAVIEGREGARRVDGRARDDLAERHPEHDELRYDVREVDDAGGLRHDVPIRRESIGPETLL